MRFLILTQYFPPEVGAPQVRLSAMVRELTSQGHQVEVVTALPNYPIGRIHDGYRGKFCHTELWEGVPVHRVWLYASQGAGFKRMVNYASFTLTSLAGLMRCRRPDYVFVESPPIFLSLVGRIASIRWHVPMIFNVADLWPDSVTEMGLMREGVIVRQARKLERWAYRKARFINAVTEGIRSSLIQKKSVAPEKILFLPNGVDTDLFTPSLPDQDLIRDLGLENKRVVVYAGTMGYAHGLEVAIQAMCYLREKQPDVVLICIGSGSEKDKLVRLAAELSTSNVRFMDPAPPEFIARLYTVAFAGLSTLRDMALFEGTRPSKLFPIMASGKAVIYSGAGEGARLVSHAHAGIITPPEDAEALAAAIECLAADPDLVRELGANGREYVRTYLSWPTIIRDWLNQLELATEARP